MIHYALRCGGGHEFDGWFSTSTSFEAQAENGLLDCPVCADTRIARALMAPSLTSRNRVPKKAAAETVPAPNKTTEPAVGEATRPREIAVLPDQMRAMLQRLRSEVERRCDYVGDRFADEARRIHDGNLPGRPIYGEATVDEADALAEDGIEIGKLPWVPRADS